MRVCKRRKLQNNIFFLFISELSDMPVATGTLYVKGKNTTADRLVREERVGNVTEYEEAAIVQYLAIGGHRDFSGLPATRLPDRVVSAIHAGPGQQTFGAGPSQRADLLLAFFPEQKEKNQPVKLFYHNYHGIKWHYEGHVPGCPFDTGLLRFRNLSESAKHDDFRYRLAQAFTQVNPTKVVFNYSVSRSCDYMHSAPILSLRNFTDEAPTYETVKELLLAEFANDENFKDRVWFKRPEQFFTPETIKAKVISGDLTGFVTVVGGREEPNFIFDRNSAAKHFGFCVQNYAPLSEEISPSTKRQIAEYYGWFKKNDLFNVESAEENVEDEFVVDSEMVDRFISKQPPRTLNSKTFHAAETISTTYLKWLMLERGFVDFDITHFIAYTFSNASRAFLEPVLQRRHEYKLAGNNVAAECLKLVGNGSFGYNGLESSNYDQIRLMTDTALLRARRKRMLHLSLKHVTMIGVVRTRLQSKKRRPAKTGSKKSKKEPRRPPTSKSSAFLFDMAAESDDADSDFSEDEDSGDDDNIDDPENDVIVEESDVDEKESGRGLSASDTESDNSQDSNYLSKKNYHVKYGSSNNPHLVPLTLTRRDSNDDDIGNVNDLDELIILEAETAAVAAATNVNIGASNSSRLFSAQNVLSDHTYAYGQNSNRPDLSSSENDDNSSNNSFLIDEETASSNKKQKVTEFQFRTTSTHKLRRKKKQKQKQIKHHLRFRYNFLFAVSISGNERRVKNTLHRAVSILSNSKKLFFGHINVLLRCLDPRLAEICYIDTDSCIFSTTHESLLDCISPEKRAYFDRCKVLADETAANSCHGQMKLEGTFRAGRFKSLKIYRLFKESDKIEKSQIECETVATATSTNRLEGLLPAYTRCKGVNRWIATKLADDSFDFQNLDRVVIHRTCLRPVRTGEMVIAHEARSLAVPFNLKRWTTDDGYHTFPLSYSSEYHRWQSQNQQHQSTSTSLSSSST